MDASTPPTSAVSGLSVRIASLAPFERAALAVLAASRAPLNRSEWARQLRELGVQRPSPAAPSAKRAAAEVAISTGDLSALLERLDGRGLVVEHLPGSHSYGCLVDARHALLDEPSVRALLERMLSSLRRPESTSFYRGRFSMAGTLQAARLAMYCRAPSEAAALFELAKKLQHLDPEPTLHVALLDPRGPVAALSLMSAELRAEYVAQVLSECLPRLIIPNAEMLACIAREAVDPVPRVQAALLAAVSGKPGAADTWLQQDASALSLEARAVLALQRAQVEEARALTVQAWHASKGKRQKPLLMSALAPLLTLLLATGSPEQVALARAQLERVTYKDRLPMGYLAVAKFLQIPDVSSRDSGPRDLGFELLSLCFALVRLYLGEALTPLMEQELKRCSARFRLLGAHWFALEAEGVLRRAAADSGGPSATLVGLREPEAAWERSLSLLEALAPESPSAPVSTPAPATDRRLAFFVRIVFREVTTQDQREAAASFAEDDVRELAEDPFEVRAPTPPRFDGVAAVGGDVRARTDAVFENTLAIEPRLQTRRGAKYTAGRAVALRTLYEASGDTDYLTADDRRVIACIQANKRYWGGRDYFFSARAALALVGHPCVFWESQPDGPAVTVVRQSPRLCAKRGEHGFYLRVEPFANAAGIGVMTDAEGRLVVTELSLPQLNVQRTITDLPPVPAQGEGRLRQVLGRMSTLFTIESHVGVDAVEKVPAETRIVLELARLEVGLRVRIAVAPLGVHGPRFVPGDGPATVAAEIEGNRLSCARDFAAERLALAALIEAAPALGDAAEGSALQLDSLTVCLSLLQDLSSLQETIIVLWLDGAPITVTHTADMSSLRLTLGEETGWLIATGALTVDEDRVLELMELLERRTPDGGFVALGNDRFVALSAELQAGLGALEAASTSADDALRVPPIALGFVSPWLRTLRAAGNLKTGKGLAKQLTRIERAYDATYSVPQTFQAELRPYQVAGFEFLARLAQLGAGACLADDMGLGKTLMTLALLVARAVDGPALIVAPTSVRANWFDEALRFAPALRMHRVEDLQLAELTRLEPFDVLVTSYTMMVQRIEQIERVRFATVVLDEAQAIKNAATQRALAASRLVADARVALTGTPVENHLGDLYGIMSFLNPGLLGDAKTFEARFAKPIQRERDARAKGQLRTLMAPFVLRRRKSDVLRELPARTEITLRVEPEADERAFSEALRRAALERLTASNQAGELARSTVSILAEITRLRRAACHPQLVDASAEVGAAKLERLVELVHELKEGGHRALIFSQFVDFLKLVRARLAADGVSYQYLDGSTAERARRAAVTEFQSGSGDVFLISLKAGGFGLNLTAADYVIHLDPWWNPAVEAQASDRAHRLGQQRPVTIYRLVNAASIEERVLSLHERKQRLAEEILSDSAEAVRLDPQALLALLAD